MQISNNFIYILFFIINVLICLGSQRDIEKLKQSNTSLENKVRALTVSENNMRLRLDESVAKYTQCREEKAQLMASLQEIRSECNLLKSKNDMSILKMKTLEEKVIQIRNTRNDVHYFEFYDGLVSNLKELFECPLSMADLTSPMILPSGNTIQENY